MIPLWGFCRESGQGVTGVKVNTAAVKKRTFEIISKAEEGDRVSKIFDNTIMILIALSILAIILESFSDLYTHYHKWFEIFDAAAVAVFTVEYILRIWTADQLYPEAKHPRLKYIFSMMALIDLLAILPFYLPFISADLRFLRMMRLFRLFRLLRVFKLGRYFDALQIIFRVIRTSGPQLVMSVVVCFFVMLFSAIVMYTVEHPVQPEQFPNVIASLWWAMCTLTTVGYGDVYPITAVGKIFASIISLVGIGIIAIPTGIIAAGFNHVFGKDHDEEVREVHNRVEMMDEEDLLALQAKVGHKLKEYGYTTTISSGGKEKAE